MGAVPGNVSLHSSSSTHSQVLEGSSLPHEVVSVLLTWDNELSLSQPHGMF